MNSLSKSLIIAGATCLPILTHAASFWGVTTANELVSFSSDTPDTFTESYAITGLKATDGVSDDLNAFMVNLSRSSSNGKLYGLDTNANFYELATNGVATLLSATFAPIGYDAGFDYDPFTDSFRFLSDAGDNAEIAHDGSVTPAGAPVYDAFDANALELFMSVALGIDPIFGLAFSIDSNLDILATTFDPNFESFFTVGDLGIDVTGLASLTIAADTGSLYAALSGDAFTSSLYTIDSTTGTASHLGDFGIGMAAITTRAETVPSPLNTGAALISGLLAISLVRRRLK